MLEDRPGEFGRGSSGHNQVATTMGVRVVAAERIEEPQLLIYKIAQCTVVSRESDRGIF